MTTQEASYVSTKECAKLIRQALKKTFPGCRFSVRTHTYSGGSHVTVRWLDGPTTKQVEAITDLYYGVSFDGSIDMAYSFESWLLPDGTVQIASSPGTQAMRGDIPATESEKPHPDAKLVRFSGSRPHCVRVVSEAAVAGVRAAFAKLDESERFKILEATRATRCLSCYEQPSSYALDADLSDFGDNAGRVFDTMASNLPLPASAT